MEIETYLTTPEKHGNGTYFFTDCGNTMYSVNGQMAYHGKLCPKCFLNGKQVTLYICGSKEANEYWNERLKMMQTLKGEKCPICKGNVYLSHDIVDGYDFGYSIGCARYKTNDGIHTKKMTIFNCLSKENALKYWEEMKNAVSIL